MVLNIQWKGLYILWIFKMRLIKNFVKNQKLYMKVMLQIYLILSNSQRVWKDHPVTLDSRNISLQAQIT